GDGLRTHPRLLPGGAAQRPTGGGPVVQRGRRAPQAVRADPHAGGGEGLLPQPGAPSLACSGFRPRRGVTTLVSRKGDDANGWRDGQVEGEGEGNRRRRRR